MEYCCRESERKGVHDVSFYQTHNHLKPAPMATTAAIAGKQRVVFPGPIIVGAGPSGLAVAACLKNKGIDSLVLERSHCIAPLWKLRTYDRLRLHLPKQVCGLPLMPFPSWFPTYSTKQQFVSYLEAYAREFDVRAVLDEAVVRAEYDGAAGSWRLRTAAGREYVCRWLVVATGENADAVEPEITGMKRFNGPVVHTSSYTSGDAYRSKRVLVVGCGNSGMEVSLDLCNHNAHPSMVVRDSVHVLPREMLGCSTFGLSMWLMKWLPIRAVDRLVLLGARFVLGDTSKFGLHRPQLGPLELKSVSGKTPVLDVGALEKIKSGDIKVCPAIKLFHEHAVEFIDGRIEEFDVVILATGYRSNVLRWLKEGELFSKKDGLATRPFPNGWKGENGLYAVGFTGRGLPGVSMDASRVAQDIHRALLHDTTKHREKLLIPMDLIKQYSSVPKPTS